MQLTEEKKQMSKELSEIRARLEHLERERGY